MTGIDPETVRDRAAEYEAREPFATVENERLETLPEAFRTGEYFWKDVEWIVRWYGRRPLDGEIHPAEEAFRRNGMDDISAAIDAAQMASEPVDRVESLLGLAGVDVPIASAILQFMAPETYTAVDERSWDALHSAGALTASYPDPVTPTDYERYLDVCRRLADEADVRTVDVGRALWRLAARPPDA